MVNVQVHIVAVEGVSLSYLLTGDYVRKLMFSVNLEQNMGNYSSKNALQVYTVPSVIFVGDLFSKTKAPRNLN